MSVITLTTDFGSKDSFVGVMKGVMLKINRESTFVDITHQITPQNVGQAAYVIYSAFSYFPQGAVHLCVVDPGVGSSRSPVVLEAAGHYFVGPDNGIFTKIIRNFEPTAIHEIVNRDFMEPDVSSTFHGRDVFAPAAAWLSRGTVRLEEFGPAVKAPVTLDLPKQVRSAANLIEGSIIYIDGFGNAVTNITRSLLEEVEKNIQADGVEIALHAGVIKSILPNYSMAPDQNTICATIGSWNTLEVFLANGDAAGVFGLAVDDHVEVRYY